MPPGESSFLAAYLDAACRGHRRRLSGPPNQVSHRPDPQDGGYNVVAEQVRRSEATLGKFDIDGFRRARSFKGGLAG